MSEYGPGGEYSRLRPRERDGSNSGPSRTTTSIVAPERDALTIVGKVLPAIAMVASSFVPWISIRLPGLEHQYLTLNELAGGRFLVGLVAVLLVVGIPLSIVRHRAGSVLVALGVALFGWFAGLAVLTIGLIRSLIPDIALAGVDIADGLLGQGPGVVLALGAAIVLSTEVSRGFSGSVSTTRGSNLLGFFSLIVIVGLAAANHSRWVVADSQTLNSQIAISGDSLFGSVIVSILTWGAAAFAAGLLAGIPAAKPRVLSILLIVMTLFKAPQLVVVWAGTSFLDWVLPNSVGEVARLDLRAGFFASCVLAAAALAIAIFGLVGRDATSKQVALRPLALVPSAALVIATIAMGFFFKPEESRGEIAIESTTTSSSLATTTSTTTTVASPATTAVVAGDQGRTSTDTDVALSTAFVVIADAEDYICAGGSGAVVGNGSYVITNEHVVSTEDLPSECTYLWVGFGADPAAEPDSWFAAEVLWSDYDLDLAILSLDDLRAGETRPLEIRYDQLKLGDEISVFGFPSIGGDTLTLTKGIISGFDNVEGFYKVSAVINKGNSGGPVLDFNGKLIGIATAFFEAKVRCDKPDQCFTDGTNLGLVRPINAAQAAIREYVR